jgi:molybdopterin-guanine dinucleotide biosynthesis protein A
MGIDKATLVVDGETLAARAARVLTSVCDPVVEVGPGVTELRSVREEPPGSGPLAALIAGVDALVPHGAVLLLACDLPFVEAPLLRLLAEWPGEGTVIPMAGDRLQYACARYGAAALDDARAQLVTGASSLRDAAGITDCDHVDEAVWRTVAGENALADVDTPDDLVRLGLV